VLLVAKGGSEIMVYSISGLVVWLGAVLACESAEPAKPSPREEEVVKVVAEPKYYVSGAICGDEMQLFKQPDPKRMWEVDGFIFEVIRPPEYAGQIIGMHHDGVLASGNPYTLWQVGRRYAFGITKENLGQLSFGPCSLHGTRRELPDNDELQGVWVATAMEINGKPAPAKDVERTRFTFKGDRLLVRGFKDDMREVECSYKNRPTRTPRQIDIVVSGKTLAGIYQVEGDQLRICYENGGTARNRPTKFATSKEQELVLIAFKREKP
jgi:uncharacterized protein (TIGR03067 family)